MDCFGKRRIRVDKEEERTQAQAGYLNLENSMFIVLGCKLSRLNVRLFSSLHLSSLR